jgi:hypothetical protein
MVAKGLESPIARLCMIVSVSAHRRPESAEAEKTMTIPGTETAVVLKTMRKTPNEMRVMTPTRRREYLSRWNMKAKPRTKMRVEDLHMAMRVFSVVWRRRSGTRKRMRIHVLEMAVGGKGF